MTYVREFQRLFLLSLDVGELVFGRVKGQLRVIHHLPVGQIGSVGNPQNRGV